MSINKNQEPVVKPGSQVAAPNESRATNQFDDARSEPRVASPQDDTFTAFFPVVDEKADVIVGKLEGRRADVLAAIQEPEHPLMMTAFDELDPTVKDCIWRNHGLHQTIEKIADELRHTVEDVKRNIISGFRSMKARIDGVNA